jgi:branched-chain amino acid transport system substrate-binding protein
MASNYRRLFMQRRQLMALAVLAAAIAAPAFSQSKEVKIAVIASKTGPLEAYAKQTIVGFNMGLDYATGGTMMVAGKKLVVIEKDDQGKPDVGKAALAAAYGDDKADIAVGPTASPVALAMLPVAEEYKKVLLVEPAVADSITGDKWNKYIFRTGRNSSQDAAANAAALDKPGNVIATLANDNAFGRDGVKAFKEYIKKGKFVHEEYLPAGTTDFTAGLQRLVDKMKDQPGRKYVWVVWAGAPSPFSKFAELELQKRYGIEMATGGNILPAMVAYKQFPGMEGALYYYFGIPKNKVNEWLVANHYKQFKAPPDFFTAGGMSAAIAVVEALKKTNGDTSAQADPGHGRHELRDAQGQDDLPQGRPPGHAGHVPLQDQERSGLRLGRARAGARDPRQRNGHSDPQQALMFGACAAAMRRCAVRENLT